MRYFFLRVLKVASVIYFLLPTQFSFSQPVQIPAPYSNSSNFNSTRVWLANKRVPIANSLTIQSPPDYSTLTTQYIDGIGRTVQTVDKTGSLVTLSQNYGDVVTTNVYDEVGRSLYKYLPFVSNNSDGNFKLDAFEQQANFYGNPSGVLKDQPELYFYNQVIYDNSPLNRVIQTLESGNSWVGNNVGPITSYDFNTVAENVRIWEIAYDSGSIPFSNTNGVYSDGVLFKTGTTDEKGLQVINYLNKKGQIILKKVQLLSSGFSNQHAGWLCTYYVYDDFGNQRFIIPPKAVSYLDANNWILTSDIVNELCFSNEYDKRGRLIVKKSPGADPVYMIYDRHDRLIFSQDGNQRKQASKNWSVSLYDNLNRVTLTGLMDYNDTRVNLQNWVDNNPAYLTGNDNLFVTGNVPSQANLMINNRDPNIQSYTAANSVTLAPGFVSNPGDNFNVFIDPTIQISTSGSNVNANPLPLGNNLYTLSQLFYDDYSYVGAKIFSSSFQIDNSLTTDEAENVQNSFQTKGLLTGSKVRLLDGGNTFLTNTSFYDYRGRLVQLQNDNHKGFNNETTSQFDFSGKVRSRYQTHRFDGNCITKIYTHNNYDPLGRIISIGKTINANPEKIIASYSYNELGLLINKTLSPGFNGVDGPQLESLDYSYNIHGNLLGINKAYAESANQFGHYFGMEIGYDRSGSQGFINPQINGDVAGIAWKSRSDNIIRKYDFTYDNTNQLINAVFNQQNIPNAAWSSDKMNFSSSYSYDENGNLKTQNQWGVAPALPPQQIDQLVYHYDDIVQGGWTNKLSRVEEQINIPANGKLGDFKNGAAGSLVQQYSYDNNANLLKDLNKDIDDPLTSGIQYNYLNLPSVISFKSTGKKLSYIYDATGKKLRKILDQPANLSNNIPALHEEIDFDDDFVYQTIPSSLGGTGMPVLQFFNHEEGRVKTKLDGSFVFDYFIKDHLSNIRMILTEDQQQNIYPAATVEFSDPNRNITPSDPIAFESNYYSIDPINININSLLPNHPNFNIGVLNNNPNYNSTSTIKQTDNSLKAYRLTGLFNKTGLGITLRVMSGDTINIYGNSFWNVYNPKNNKFLGASQIINGFLSTPTGATFGKGNASDLVGNSLIFNGITNFLLDPLRGSQTVTNGSAIPRAAINWILFNDQFEVINTGFSLVGPFNELKDHSLDAVLRNIPVTRNGYLYVYCSNESIVGVYFDNLQVVHSKGQIIEENHFYPFGLKIAAISSKSADTLQNNYGYQGDYSENNSETQLNEFDLRHYDPQIGRWTTPDPYEEFPNPYVGMGNSPILNTDPSGGSLDDWFAVMGEKGIGLIHEVGNHAATLITNGLTLVNVGGDELNEDQALLKAGNIFATLSSPRLFNSLNISCHGDYNQLIKDAYDKRLAAYNSLDRKNGQVDFPLNWFIASTFGDRSYSGIDPTTGYQVVNADVNTNGYLTHKPKLKADSPFGLISGVDEVEIFKEIEGVGSVENVGWRVGDPITNFTSKGNIPTWSTVRRRFWKNEALLNSKSFEISNLNRMKNGLAPQRINSNSWLLESMELHHHPVPQRDGGLFEFIKVWPDEHKKLDIFRK